MAIPTTPLPRHHHLVMTRESKTTQSNDSEGADGVDEEASNDESALRAHFSLSAQEQGAASLLITRSKRKSEKTNCFLIQGFSKACIICAHLY